MNQIWGIIEGEVKDDFWVLGLSNWRNEGVKQGWVVK